MIHTILEYFREVLGSNAILYHAVLGAIIVIVSLVCGKIVKFLLRIIGRKIIYKTENRIDDQILDILSEKIIAFSAIVGAFLLTKELRYGLAEEHETFLTLLRYIENILYIITALLITAVVIKIVRAIISQTFSARTQEIEQRQFNQTLPLLLNRVAGVIIIVLATIVVLDQFGQNISSILTLLGVGSLALGLAAQDTISNMISGFIIMIDRPFRVGDRVKIPTGETGDVYEIGLRSTKILDFDQNLLIVPNNELVKTRIVNYSYPHSEVRIVVEISVAYGSDIEKVKKIMLGVAEIHPDIVKNPPPEVYVMKLADSGINFSLFCRVADFKMQFKIAEALRVKIYKELMKAKIEIPYPQQVIHHKYEPENALQASQKRKKIPR